MQFWAYNMLMKGCKNIVIVEIGDGIIFPYIYYIKYLQN
jgi:hypothetical protein